MEQEIRFCTARDGVRIAYATSGAGPPLVKAANWLNHLEFDWESPIWRHLIRELSRDHLLVRYDERGNGLSDWDVQDMSLDAWVTDLEAVVDAAGLERFALLGISQGASVSIEYADRHPERVTHLVLHGGYARGWRKRDEATEEEEKKQEAFLSLIRAGWGKENPAFRQVFSSLFIPEATKKQMDWFAELQRVTTTPQNAVRIREAFADLDVTDRMPRISAPTLVLHSRNEAAVPFAEGRLMAASIPGARFVPLESGNHLILEQEPAWPIFVSEVKRFLGSGNRSWSRVDAVLREALEQPAESRERWLDDACRDDSALRREVSRLLALSESEQGDPLRTHGGLEGAFGLEVAEGLARGEATATAPAPAAGERIGSYEIIERIGQGAMGTVFRALNPGLDREVAVKALSPSFLTDDESVKRFEREAKLLASLSHPGIAGVYDLVVERGKHFLILELVDGRSLDELLSAGPLPVGDAIGIARELVDAIEAAHEKAIVHRDLKPANIKLTKDGRVKVLDFGLAKSMAAAHASSSSATTQGTILGTPRYMSPEQARGERADERADIWAFGALLFEMLSGEPAFDARTPAECIASVLRDEVDFGQLPETTPEPLRELLQRCLEKDPERRMRRIGDARHELTEAVPAPTPRKYGLALALVVAVAAVALVAIAYLLLR